MTLQLLPNLLGPAADPKMSFVTGLPNIVLTAKAYGTDPSVLWDLVVIKFAS